MNKNIQPSFLLKNINFTEIHKKYKQGYYNREIQQKSLINPIVKIHNNNKTDKVKYKDIQLSGQKYVELYCKNNYNNIKGGRCDNCKRDFTGDIIGYPISYEEYNILQENNTFKNYHVFWIEGCFHSYECCLEYVEKINQHLHKYYQDFDVKIMLQYMYCLINGNKKILKPSNDPYLLIDNGGEMTQEEWSNPDLKYKKTYNVIKIPAQVVYTKI
jgi:hypothetical protein